MEVSSQANSYQMMNMYQKPDNSIQPVPAPTQKPTTSAGNEDVYSASNGNAIKAEDGTLTLTPEGELNVANAQDEKSSEVQAQEQAQQDQQRENGADYIAHKSMQSQVEIYLSVATDNKVEFGDNDTASIIESLRDVQKQNNQVEAYATYSENQKNAKPFFV